MEAAELGCKFLCDPPDKVKTFSFLRLKKMQVFHIQDFVIVSLDLLSGLVEGLGFHIEGLVSSSGLLLHLSRCLQVFLFQIKIPGLSNLTFS